MRTVWKINLDPAEPFPDFGEVPAGGKILSVDQDPGNPHLVAVWFLVLTEHQPDTRPPHQLYLTGTGHPVGDFDTFVGTAMCPPFAWHVWEKAQRT